MNLAHLVVGAADAPVEGWIVHGILGSGTNWRSIARRLVAARPEVRWVLVDLRGHGDSPVGDPPHDLAACVRDLSALAERRGRGPDVLVGHSFGGKVVLLAGETLAGTVRQVWVLDAVPGPSDGFARGDEDVLEVIATLRRIPVPLTSRGGVRAPLRAAGFSEGLAGWMTTNLVRGDEGFRWRFDLDVVQSLLADYARRDLWPVVERLRCEVHLVRAARSGRWTAEALARLERASERPGVSVLTLDAGHWIHVDRPDELVTFLVLGLERLVPRT